MIRIKLRQYKLIKMDLSAKQVKYQMVVLNI